MTTTDAVLLFSTFSIFIIIILLVLLVLVLFAHFNYKSTKEISRNEKEKQEAVLKIAEERRIESENFLKYGEIQKELSEKKGFGTQPESLMGVVDSILSDVGNGKGER